MKLNGHQHNCPCSACFLSDTYLADPLGLNQDPIGLRNSPTFCQNCIHYLNQLKESEKERGHLKSQLRDERYRNAIATNDRSVELNLRQSLSKITAEKEEIYTQWTITKNYANELEARLERISTRKKKSWVIRFLRRLRKERQIPESKPFFSGAKDV